ncbi:MAG TPA: chromate efflux transporter [Vicinamibacterales bacterium]
MRQLFLVFLRLGLTAVGGPAAHIALMSAEFVDRRRWISREEFLDLLAISNLLPGPTSTELALHIGHTRAGAAGLIAAGVGFIAPAALLTAVLAAIYVRAGSLPLVQPLLAGLKPAVVAIVAVALIRLAPGTAASPRSAVTAAIALVLALMGVHELIVLAAGGIVAALLAVVGRASSRLAVAAPVLLVPLLGAQGATAAPTALTLFLLFLKVGAVLFGSGYVLLAFLRAELVVRLQWLTDAQLLDAVAVGQMTPGPVFTTATFVGYLLSGPSGAAAATVGIFLPSFLFVALSGTLTRFLRAWPVARTVLDGVVAASLALMAAVTVELARAALVSLPGLAVAGLCLLLLFTTRLNPAVCLLIGAVAGLLGTIGP